MPWKAKVSNIDLEDNSENRARVEIFYFLEESPGNITKTFTDVHTISFERIQTTQDLSDIQAIVRGKLGKLNQATTRLNALKGLINREIT